MAECTAGERAWLDALAMPNGDGRQKAIAEARSARLMEKVPADIYANLVALRRTMIDATHADTEAWSTLALDPDETERLWDRVTADAKWSP